MAIAAEGAHETARLIRSARLRDMLAAIEEFWRAGGPDRAYWRSQGSHLIRQWRRLYPHYWEVSRESGCSRRERPLVEPAP